MKYLFLLYADESATVPANDAERDAVLGAYDAFFQEVDKRGVFTAGEAVHPSATATSVAVRDGRAQHTPGPARPGGEQVIGFYLLDVSGQDEALELAAKIPAATIGRVETRPVVVFG